MTASEWDGTPWGGDPVAQPTAMVPWGGPPPGAATIVAKAVTGGDAIWNGVNRPIGLNRNPLRAMREAQTYYWSHPWIGGAEDTITRRVSGLPMHIEDDDETTVDDEENNPTLKQVRNLLEKPQAAIDPTDRQVGIRSWKDLSAITSRHMGLCGISYWFKDQVDTNGIPLALLYVNPARLYPVTSDKGALMGYVLDPVDDYGRGGTPVRRDRIIAFYLAPPDWGALPRGLVERALLKARVNTMTDQHLAYLLSTGGRIPGMIAPKDGYIADEARYEQLVRDIRIASEATDAATRTTILRGPIEFFETGADPTNLALGDVARLTRDDINSIWGIPQSQAGIASPTGMNSGETRGFENQVLMTGPVHDRVEIIRSTVQFELLDLWNAVGQNPQLVIEEPDFDDDSVPYELASKASSQPLTVNERRAILKMDPLPEYGPDGEPLGLAIVLPINLSPFGQGPEDGASDNDPFPNAPGPKPTPPQLIPFTGQGGNGTGGPNGQGGNGAAPGGTVPLGGDGTGRQPVPPEFGKADGDFLGLRASVDRKMIPPLRRSVGDVLRQQRDSIVSKFRARAEAILKKPAIAATLWDATTEDVRLRKALTPHLAQIATTVAKRASSLLQQPAKADDAFEEEVLAQFARETGRRVTGINETTRDAIIEAIRAGIEEGETADEIASRLESLPAFDEARAELVARTEAGRTYNAAAIESYSQFGIDRVEAIDGDQDPECAARSGQTFTLEEAAAIEDHPNGTLDWVPLFAGKAGLVTEYESPTGHTTVRTTVRDRTFGQTFTEYEEDRLKATIPQITISPEIHVHEREQPAPIVNVTAAPPVVNVSSSPAVVNVPAQPAPVVNVAAPEPMKASSDAVVNMRIVGMPTRTTRKKISRTGGGQIDEVAEVTTDAGE